MSDLLANLALGFSVAAHPYNIGFCLLGALVGTLVGVLPGIGTVATVAMLLPITFGLPPVGALIMLAGIYYGAQYGGSTTSVLVNIPGEAGSVVTCLDGHQMARQGRAGAALSIAAIGSFFAGCVATVLVCVRSCPGRIAKLLPGLGASSGPRDDGPRMCGRFGAEAAASHRRGSLRNRLHTVHGQMVGERWRSGSRPSS